MKHELVSVQAQFTLTEVATDATTDIACRRCPVIGIEPDPVQIRGETQAFVPRGLGSIIQQDIA
ncbi:hypothetical protein D3C81_2122910 [compost metagenome]